MSNKIGLLLSLIIFLQAFFLCLDIINLQTTTTRLTIESNYVNVLIAKNKEVNDEVYQYVDVVMRGKLTCLTSCSPGINKQLKYQINVPYKSIFKNKEQTIAITRSVLIGNLV